MRFECTVYFEEICPLIDGAPVGLGYSGTCEVEGEDDEYQQPDRVNWISLDGLGDTTTHINHLTEDAYGKVLFERLSSAILKHKFTTAQFQRRLASYRRAA